MKTKIILVLTLARSGSNNLINCFRNFKNINVNSEFFNPTNFWVNDFNKNLLVKKYGINYQKNIKENNLKCESLLHVADNCKEEFLVLKVFPPITHQLSENELRYLIDNNYIHFVFVLERKNIIDRYISFTKAIKLGTWDKVDTSHVKIYFDIKKYNDFKTEHLQSYELYKDILKNTTNQFKINQDKYLVDNRQLANKIKKCVPELAFKENCTFPAMKKQDNANHYSDKIENYADIKEFLDNELKSFK